MAQLRNWSNKIRKPNDTYCCCFQYWSWPSSLPADVASGCSWNWEDVSLHDTNLLTVSEVKNRNLKIGPYVMDLPAMKFFQHQVQYLNRFCLNNMQVFGNCLKVKFDVKIKTINLWNYSATSLLWKSIGDVYLKSYLMNNNEYLLFFLARQKRICFRTQYCRFSSGSS
jgi:hypothetical protein